MAAAATTPPTLVPPHIRRAIDQAVRNAVGRIQREGPVLEVTFPSMAFRVDVAHGLGQVPTGYHIVLQAGGLVQAVDVDQWTDTVAYLQATADYTRARVFFVVTDEVTRA